MRASFTLALALFLLHDASKQDLDKMQGDWAAVSYTADGQQLPDDDAQAFFRSIKGNEYTVFRFDKAIGKGTFTLDASRNPKTIDAIPTLRGGKGKPIFGIYEIKDNRLRFCFAAPGKDRPADFASPPDSGRTLTVWEREKK
jgi:uncharacterized protein (TIGR03067 family)